MYFPPKIIRLGVLFLAFSFWLNLTAASFGADALPALPKVFCADPQALLESKACFATNDAALKPAFDKLFSDARKALSSKPVSVIEKNRIPPSGDKHDYVSQAPYYWPDTNSADGKYIRHDGERNPESKVDSDDQRLNSVCSRTHTLALAFYFSGDEKYAAKATELLRVFFLDPATRMNPNLNFGQGIPGQCDGRPSGLITARGFVELVDALGLLEESKSWTAADRQGMKSWLEKYFNWLTTSKIGLGERKTRNNHGSFYDGQAAAIALFIGQPDFARNIVAEARTKRIAFQIEPDGRQPLELARTKSFGYSAFNLRALVDLASIAQNLGVDLWHYQSTNGACLLAALQFMAPYADAHKKWPFQQIYAYNHTPVGELLLRATPQYPGAGLEHWLAFFRKDELADNRERLLFRTARLDLTPVKSSAIR
jgi:Alginate lyase